MRILLRYNNKAAQEGWTFTVGKNPATDRPLSATLRSGRTRKLVG